MTYIFHVFNTYRGDADHSSIHEMKQTTFLNCLDGFFDQLYAFFYKFLSYSVFLVNAPLLVCLSVTLMCLQIASIWNTFL